MSKIKMIKCPACGAKVSCEANACPKCGQPVTDEIRDAAVKKEMKKNFFWGIGCLTFIILPIVISFCSGPDDKPLALKTYTNSIGMEFVLVPAGSFMMGSPDSDKHAEKKEKPQHKVNISKPFYLGKYEVTQEQWEAVMGNNPSRDKGRTNPVEKVSWNDAQEFIKRLNAREGHSRYRLPTEAEWEYACRAGTTTVYSFGDDADSLGRYAWYDDNSGKGPQHRTHPVGQKKGNAWGLHDMHGNVFEWVQDWYAYYYNSTGTDRLDPSIGDYFVCRGGNLNRSAEHCRSSYRDGETPDGRRVGYGFRLALSQE
jgi:formylglycine-generating enzyme required for sulfatase activity